MDRPNDVIELIDGALERFAARDIVQASEIVDFLLDLRSVALEHDELSRFLAEESTPQPS